MTEPYDPFAGIPEGSRVMVAFSGGVDSSVAAYLCKEAGFEVTAVTMSLPGTERFQGERAVAAAEKLGIPLDVLDLSREFEDVVMRRTWEEYAQGRTPNPCALCNPRFKFGKLMEFAKEKHCAALATGHYAVLLKQPGGTGSVLRKGVCAEKDQSYFLFGLTPEQLSFACFPLGAMSKVRVRELARSLGLPNADAEESQDACFAPRDGSNMAEMLRRHFHGPVRTGDFVSTDGRVLGKHSGIHAYTIGQRKGTGVAMGTPAYVLRIDAERQTVVLTRKNEDLLSRTVLLDPPHILHEAYRGLRHFECSVKIRYRSRAVPAEATLTDSGSCRLVFQDPQRAVTPGQAAVFYDKETLIGGAWIRSAEPFHKED
ncbi:MAG: tRNA-specific 2-thiouridylase MnmA [Lentisphaerae bacterium ADurb.Bin242]|nr:MAG: tRNA-specific 2-thiouridylase MnmA [Lentisphaerae bacterium ADurb.Bin242]